MDLRQYILSPRINEKNSSSNPHFYHPSMTAICNKDYTKYQKIILMFNNHPTSAKCSLQLQN